jgi:hypothetical protein
MDFDEALSTERRPGYAEAVGGGADVRGTGNVRSTGGAFGAGLGYEINASAEDGRVKYEVATVECGESAFERFNHSASAGGTFNNFVGQWQSNQPVSAPSGCDPIIASWPMPCNPCYEGPQSDVAVPHAWIEQIAGTNGNGEGGAQ